MNETAQTGVDRESEPARGPWKVVAVLAPLTAFTFGVTTRTINLHRLNYEAYVIIGVTLASLIYWHRYRGLGLAVYSYSGAFLTGIAVLVLGEWSPAAFVLAAGFLVVAFLRTLLYLSMALRDTPQGAWGLIFLMFCFLAVYVGTSIGGNPMRGWDPPPSHLLWLPVLAGFLTLLSWYFLYRPAVELSVVPLLLLMYRVRGVGPGLKQIPAPGPCLVVANHSCWVDPFFLAKLLPRPITPMMTSRFYDLPVARWILKYVIRAIRVPEEIPKQDVPDSVREAIAALDRGECVVIFPEGALRRSEEKPLKRFGRGVWQILSARPETPVFTCWIEGGWRSFFSYFNGPPTKSKRPDIRRRIGVAVPEAITLDPAILANHLQTRIHLMNRVIESRKLLGLAELPAYELPNTEEEAT